MRYGHVRAILDENTSLRRLYVNWNQSLRQATLEYLSKNRTLSKLAYSQKVFGDDEAEVLFQNVTIKVLNIPYTQVSNACLKALARNGHISVLKIKGTRVSASGIQFIKDHCHAIRELSYSAPGSNTECLWWRIMEE